jgi:hypothetical protein
VRRCFLIPISVLAWLGVPCQERMLPVLLFEAA